MIEKIVLDDLNSALTESVHMETPKDIPDAYVLIEKTSESMENQIWSATLAIQSISSQSLYAAALLSNSVKNEMLYGLITNSAVSKVSLNSEYNFTDSRTKQYRYQAVYDIIFKEV